MKIRDVLFMLATITLPYALEPMQGARWYETDVCCTSDGGCPTGQFCRLPNGGQDCSPDLPGFCSWQSAVEP